MVLQEAQAMGLPVVCTNHNGFSESILDGQTGFLVPERDVDAISTKLAQLISQRDLWLEIGKKGRAFVEAEFDLRKRNDALIELYRSLSEVAQSEAFKSISTKNEKHCKMAPSKFSLKNTRLRASSDRNEVGPRCFRR
jgi:hypothetical protein